MNTREVVRRLGTTADILRRLIYTDKLAPPTITPSGDYLWSDADVERARAALKVHLRRKGQRAGEAVAT